MRSSLLLPESNPSFRNNLHCDAVGLDTIVTKDKERRHCNIFISSSGRSKSKSLVSSRSFSAPSSCKSWSYYWRRTRFTRRLVAVIIVLAVPLYFHNLHLRRARIQDYKLQVVELQQKVADLGITIQKAKLKTQLARIAGEGVAVPSRVVPPIVIPVFS